jgi:hypothetical protein
MNKDTAITQAGLNSTNQVTPQGSLTYSQNGTWPDGTPRYTATQTYSPTEQGIYDLGAQTRTNLGNIGVEQSDKIRQLLGTNVDLSNDAVESRLFDLGSKRLDPKFAQQESQMRTDLLNRGFREGTPAFENELKRFSEQKNDAYNSLLLSGHQQGVSDILAERNAPINEISALLSGSQVSQPSYTNTPQTQVSGTDYAGLVNSNYQTQANQYGSMMGGLAGLGGSLAGAGAKMWAASDRRLKEDIKRIGAADNGLPIYSYRYIGDPETKIGFMSDDVRKLHPDAVMQVGGYDVVDYARAVE